jgi:rSAM/selenodomain-associated transferase 2
MGAISIVIPVLDDAVPLGRLLTDLRSAADAARGGVEVIVVDGGSRDGSAEVAAGAADRVLVAPSGRAIQLAAGIGAAAGRLIWMLHADSRVTAGHVLALDAMLTDARYRWGRFDVRLDAAGPLYRAIETGMNLRSYTTGICTGDQGIFVRREMLDAIGGIPQQALMEDVELSRRLRRLGRPLCARPALITSARRWQSHGVLETVILMWSLRVRYFLGADPAVLARSYRAGPT